VKSAARWLTASAVASVMSVAVAIPALAHPLGNFTINHYSRVELVGDQARVLYVLDLAEIPTFQEKQRIADDSTYLGRQVEKLSQNLILTVDGKPLPLKMTDHSMQFLPGQGGLQTERLEVSLVGASALPKGQHQAVYRDNNFQGRLGWKEIVVQASAEAQLTNSSVPAASVSQELRKYPQDMLTSPLDVTQASFRFVPGRALTTTGQSAPLKMAGAGLGLVQDRFAALIAPRDLSLPLLGFSLLIAIVLGGLHALSPGHGKAVMAGYLVGTQGSKRHALILGLTITITHTAGVFALGLVTLYAATLVTPERLYPWLTLFSGVMILVIGGTLILTRLRAAFHGHSHEHGHDHAARKAGLSRRNVIILGITGGLIPCPTALVVLLSALSLHRVAFGMLLIVAYSVGLAIVLSGIGIALASGTAIVSRLRPALSLRGLRRGASLIPVASAVVVAIAGIALTAQALPAIR
jgi:ABC-type nickel/cobalt efflux system permease component RcnA